MRTINKKKYCKLKKGVCFLGCEDYKNGDCPGYYSTLTLSNSVKINIPLYNEFKNNYFEEIIVEIKKNGYITKIELLEILKKESNFSKRNLQFYIDEGLIEPGIREYFPGISGAVSFYSEKTPVMIAGIKELNEKHKLTIKEISTYKNLIYNFDEWELSRYLTNPPLARMFADTKYNRYKNRVSQIEKAKFNMVLNYYACAELGYKYYHGWDDFIIDKKQSFVSIEPVIKDNIITEIQVEVKDNEPGFTNSKTIGNIVYSKRGIEIKI